MPPDPGTGRRRVYCTPACRKAAYEDRRAKKPGAVQVKLVDRLVVETVETTRVIDRGHTISQCLDTVADSPRAAANLPGSLTARIKNDEVLHDPKWQPVLRALAELTNTVADKTTPRRRW
jgi:hypothetical protein